MRKLIVLVGLLAAPAAFAEVSRPACDPTLNAYTLDMSRRAPSP